MTYLCRQHKPEPAVAKGPLSNGISAIYWHLVQRNFLIFLFPAQCAVKTLSESMDHVFECKVCQTYTETHLLRKHQKHHYSWYSPTTIMSSLMTHELFAWSQLVSHQSVLFLCFVYGRVQGSDHIILMGGVLHENMFFR